MDNKYLLARKLRKSQTPQEQKIWSLVRNRKLKGLKFKRQFPIGKYIVDFVCEKKRLVIELDGGQHNEEKNIEYDKNRTAYIESKGYKLVRFWNNDVDSNLEGVYESLLKLLD